MWGGKLVARVPHRIARAELDRLIGELREGLNSDLHRQRIFEDDQLLALARQVERRWLKDLQLPPYEVRFVARMRKRWASCTAIRGVSGKIHVSRALRGHPRWILEHILLHELIHLEIPNHGPRFRQLLERSPHGERADGYLEALEHHEQWGQWFCGLPEASHEKTTRPLSKRTGQFEIFGPGED